VSASVASAPTQKQAFKATVNSAPTVAAGLYQLNPAQSRFMVHAYSTGPLWFLGHNHHVAIREFSGQIQATQGTLTPASLEMNVRANSLAETGANFTAEQRRIIDGAMREQVLEIEKFPEMSFRTTSVTATQTGQNEFDARLTGDFTLHGVTRPIEIPAHVLVNGKTIHATGKFSIRRSDYNVKTHSVKWGTVRVRNKVNFEFDIVAVASSPAPNVGQR
jgi:polyisoprenoid-binding protein YceI